MSKIMKKNTFEIVVGVLVILFSVLFVMFTMKITNDISINLSTMTVTFFVRSFINLKNYLTAREHV